MEKVRQMMIEKKYKKKFRELEVTYVNGETGSGKTRDIMEKYDYEVYSIGSYDNPFDGYAGQDIIVFDEFRSSLKIQDMLKYLDGYPLWLPCRYNNKVACYTKVYIVSNIPIEKQYTNIQKDEPKTWEAFERRIHKIKEYTANGIREMNWKKMREEWEASGTPF